MKKIPITVAKRIADDYDYNQVIIIAWNKNGTTHITTYGTDKEQCRQAAIGGKVIADSLGLEMK